MKKPVVRINKRKKALELIEVIFCKLNSLKHGYKANEQFDELRDLVKTMK